METVKDYWEKATPMNFELEKWDYEKKRKFRYDLQDYMHEVFGFQEFKGQEVLEVGCGSGIDALEFAKNGAIVTATDITDCSMVFTSEIIKQAGLLNIKYIQASGDNLPFKSNSFDCIYSFGVLHHIKNVDAVLMEIKRVLRPDGKVMAMLYNRDSLLFAYSIVYLHGLRFKAGFLDNLCWEDIEQLTCDYSERIEGCPYTKAYTKDEAYRLFERYFKNIEISTHYNVIDTPQQRKVKLNISDDYEFGWHLVIKAMK